MQLISIETTNFKKLRRFKADFTQGLNVIVGDNAQGKSTLLQAIECALYGSTVVPGKKDKIPTWGQSSWKVELVFTLDGEDYRLTRSKSTAKLERFIEGGTDADLVANGNTPVTAAVAELLDLDAKDFNLFMQSKQGETSGVLTFGAAALNRKVEEFAGISLIDRVQGLAQEEYRTKKAEADAKAVPEEEVEEAKQHADVLADHALDAEKGLKDAQEALDALPLLDSLQEPDADPDALQARLNRITKLTGKVERAGIEVGNARDRYQEAKQRFEELEAPEDAEELAAKLNALSKEARSASSRVSELSRQVDSRRQLWDQLVKAEQVMDDDLPEDELGEKLSKTVEELGEFEAMGQTQTRRVNELNYQIQQLTSFRKDANCPTCGTRLKDHDPEKLEAEIVELAEQRDEAEQRRAEADKQCRALDAHRHKLEKQLQDRQAHEDEVDRLREALTEWPSAEKLDEDLRIASEVHEGAVSEKASLEHRVEQLEDRQRRYRRAERSVRTEKRSLEEFIEELQTVSDELEELLAEGEPTEADIEEARKAWRKYLDDKSALGLKRRDAYHAVKLAEQAFNQSQKDLGRARGDVETLNRQRVEAVLIARDADRAARLTRFLRERRAGYLQEVWDAVLAAASKQVAMASKGMIGKLVYDEGDFLFEEDGVLAPVASASGAQKAHIGVALRIGLSRALYGSDALIIFDEPTESMSEHHASGLSASLAGAASQCLLITHREQDQDLAANVVEVAA